MLSRWSVNVLLKSVVLVMSAVMVVTFALGAWDAYSRYGVAERMTTLTQASDAVFRALNNFRLDRSFTDRALRAETVGPADRKQVTDARDAEMPALKAALATFATVNFPAGKTYIDALRGAVSTLDSAQAESLAAFDKPKAQRRDTLDKDYVALGTLYVDNLDKLATELGAAVKGTDPFIDEMMTLKQLGWTARNAAGDGSVVISNSIIAGQFVPDGQAAYLRAVTQTDTAWSSLEAVGYGTTLPGHYLAALAKAKNSYFASDLSALRDHVFKQLAAGEKPDITATAWTTRSVPSIQTLLEVILAALGAATDRATAMSGDALQSLALHLALLAGALGLAVGSFMAIGGRALSGHCTRSATGW